MISQINSTNSSIKVLCDQKNKLYTQINELNYLKSKYQNLQSKFSQRQTSRINTLNSNFSRELNVQFIKSYVKGMSSLLGGNEYRNAYNGLTNAINVISDKIKSLQRQIDSIQGDINSKNRNNDSRQREIHEYQNRINNTNNLLSYRKQRIKYWRNQLRYAT